MIHDSENNSRLNREIERYRANPFDLVAELYRMNSDQTIHMVIHFSGQIDPERMKNAVDAAVHAEPRCRCRLVEDNGRLWWQPAGNDVHRDFFRYAVGDDPVSGIGKAVASTLDPHTDPVIQAILIPAPGGDTLVLNASHVAMDGKGLKEMAALILDFYDTPGHTPHPGLQETGREDRNLPVLSTVLAGQLQETRPHTTDSRARWTFPVTSGGAEQKKCIVMTIPAARMQCVHAARRSWGITLNDLMLAVLAISCRTLPTENPPECISFYNPIDLRRYVQDNSRSVANYSTAFEVCIPVSSGGDVQEISRTVHGIMEGIKASYPGYSDALDAEGLWNLDLTSARTIMARRHEDALRSGTHIPIVSNTGIIDLACFTGRVANAYLLACHSAPPTIFFTFSTYEDRMTVTSSYYSPAIQDDAVRKVFRMMDRLIPADPDTPGDTEFLLFPGVQDYTPDH